MKLSVKDMIDLLTDDTNLTDKVIFDVKKVTEEQDFAEVSDIYWDDGFVIELR